MAIQYIDPLTRGFGRMKVALFTPFDLKKWFVVGFTAFLAGLTDFHGGSGTGAQNQGHLDWGDFFSFPQRGWDWLVDHPGWFMLIVVGATALFLVLVVLTWVSSRGKFAFLDNVVRNGSRVAVPWREYRTEGNSLFIWRFSFGLIVVAVILAYAIVSFSTLYEIYQTAEWEGVLIGPAILLGLGFIALLLLVAYVGLLVQDFVVPIMYRSRITILKGWQAFLPLFSHHFFYFVGYGFLILFLGILVVVGVILAGLLTCCLGFLLLLIPYINSVVLLPVSYTFRAFSVEFLEQFGEEYHLFPQVEAPPMSTPAGSTSL